MSRDVQSRVCSEEYAKGLIIKLYKAQKRGLLEVRKEKNDFLWVSFCGTGKISNKWNVKIYLYSYKKGGCSVVCNDWQNIDLIMSEKWDAFEISYLPVISIDDSGWGFPLCGVMVGVSDGEQVKTDVVDVEFFKGTKFLNREYLEEYAFKALGILEEMHVHPATHSIEICTGYVNTVLKNILRKHGFKVRVVEIQGLLQDQLELRFKEYVKEVIGSDIYYDPKDMKKEDIPFEYHKCLKIGQKKFPHLLKSGWQSMKGVANERR